MCVKQKHYWRQTGILSLKSIQMKHMRQQVQLEMHLKLFKQNCIWSSHLEFWIPWWEMGTLRMWFIWLIFDVFGFFGIRHILSTPCLPPDLKNMGAQSWLCTVVCTVNPEDILFKHQEPLKSFCNNEGTQAAGSND